MQSEYLQKYLLLQYCGLLGELLESSQRFLMRNCTLCTLCTVCSVHIERRGKEVFFDMHGIFSLVKYYRKEIFVKGRGPVG